MTMGGRGADRRARRYGVGPSAALILELQSAPAAFRREGLWMTSTAAGNA